jgi:MscS family membrane protein
VAVQAEVILAARETKRDNAMEEAAQSLGQVAQGIQETGQRLIPRDGEAMIGHISAVEIGLAFGVALITLAIRWLFLRVAGGLFPPEEAYRQSLGREIAVGIVRTMAWAILLSGLFVALGLVDWPSRPVNWQAAVWRCYSTLVIMFLAMLAFRLASVWLRIANQPSRGLGGGLVSDQIAPLLRDLLKVAMLIGALLLIVQVWGYNATALLAGVGIGGLAVAFAAQDAIANVLGSVVIYTDRPFKVGDWVQIAGITGTVEEIGIRSTRIRQFDKPVVSVPNKQVANEKIFNYSAMTERRVRFSLALPYNTPPGKLERALAALRPLVGERDGALAGSALVHLESLGASGLSILVQVLTPITTYEPFLEWQEALLLDILRELEEHGIEIALPSQSVYLRNTGDEQGSGGVPIRR